MQAAPTKVIEYFNGEKQNLIPLFQRPYTWDESKWKTLWDDVMVQYDLGDDGIHFLGTIVSAPAKSVPVGVSKFLIIDGQQRLTTISLLLCALRDCLGAQDSQRIQEVYLTNRFRTPEDTLKLVPTQADRDVYRGLVMDKHAAQDGPLLCKAYYFFRRQLTETRDGNDDPIQPSRVLLALERTLQVVMINLDENDDPYLVFESLNSKGEPLKQADLVRNYLLMRFKHTAGTGGEQETIYSTLWKPLEDMLGASLTEFMRHYTMRFGDDLRQGGIYAAIKGRMKELNTPEQVKAEIATMNQFGGFYARFFDPARESSPHVRARLENFQALPAMSTSYPLLLRLLHARDTDALTETGLEQCLGLVEAFTVRRSACGVPTNALNKLFLQWCKDFPSANHAEWLLASMSKGGGSRRFPTDSEFGEAMQHQPQYGRGATRYILCQLERSFKHKEPVDLGLKAVTIEHVLPQTLTPEWEEELRDDNADADAKAIHARLIDTFGNLTLTAYNSEMGNEPFADKRERLAKSHIELSRAIAGFDHWREHEIYQRAADLLGRALKIWPGPIPIQN
jgi:hypothetical protein